MAGLTSEQWWTPRNNQVPDIEVDLHSVTIEGLTIKRPQRLSVSQWLQFWQKIQDQL
jgi:hypothetical protein